MKQILCVAAILCLVSCAAVQPEERDITVVIVADLHFDAPPETDQYYHVVTINNLENNFIFPQNAMSGIAGRAVTKIDGVIIAGDMFDQPGADILQLYKDRYEMQPDKDEKNIRYPVYPGYGNHDIDPISSDSLKNLEGRKFLLAYLDSVLHDKLAKGEILNLHPGSRSYSWNTGDVHFIQAQRFSGDTGYGESNFEWLEEELATYAANGVPVVYIQHYGVDPWALTWWPQEARNRLFDLLDQYNIVAIFVGHTHIPTLQYYRGYPVYQVNNAWPDRDGNGSFAVMRIKGDAVSVANCRWLDGQGTFEVIDPYLNDTLPRQINKDIHYNAFSHNDYWRDNPLEDALAFRFNCVEADLWMIDGELYVAHDRPAPDPAITFENLYLKPLQERIRLNKGKVYPESDRPFYLMLDCKTNGEEMYPLLKKQLEPYKEMFCMVEENEYREGAVLIFISGDRPRKTVEAESTRTVFLDGQVKDLGKNMPATLMPVISDNYAAFFNWTGEGEMPEEELRKMRRIIDEVHAEGKLFRWWGAPDNRECKKIFLEQGVDLIGTDRLNDLFHILAEK
ncbi:MAG: metallophosphoesterase [Tannerellaceae bacterium]|nr:metallophosphoesterase [Tannerellaceae bacterium]